VDTVLLFSLEGLTALVDSAWQDSGMPKAAVSKAAVVLKSLFFMLTL
jgi:hypothetical protein